MRCCIGGCAPAQRAQKKDSQEHRQKPAMKVGMAVSVENRQQDQTRSTRDRE